jgi:uncharacterized membrane protein
MTQLKKRALYTIAIWGALMLPFVILFFAGGGPERYLDERWRRVLVGGTIAAAFLLYAVMLYFTRKRPGEIASDERDIAIRGKANEIAFTVVLLYVFLVSIALFEHYRPGGSVPAGWMWFLAYSTVFSAYVTSSACILVMESRSAARGKG